MDEIRLSTSRPATLHNLTEMALTDGLTDINGTDFIPSTANVGEKNDPIRCL